MAMKVLLRRTIDGVGQVGQVVRVRNGYARNYLFPMGYAALVTPDAMARIEKDKAADAVRQAELARERQAVAERLAALTLTIEARAGEDGHLYGSVGPRHVLAALAEQGLKFEERHVRFDPVRELGEYEVTVALTREQAVPVKLFVVQDAREAALMAEEAQQAAAQGAAAEGEPWTGPGVVQDE